MKNTDIIIRFDPSLEPTNALQIVVLDTPNYGKQIIELDRTKLIAVPLEEDQWAKLKTDRRETIKLDSSGNYGPRRIFDYICYTITTEKKGSEKEPNCDYFINNSTPYKATKQKTKSNKLRPASN